MKGGEVCAFKYILFCRGRRNDLLHMQRGRQIFQTITSLVLIVHAKKQEKVRVAALAFSFCEVCAFKFRQYYSIDFYDYQ